MPSGAQVGNSVYGVSLWFHASVCTARPPSPPNQPLLAGYERWYNEIRKGDKQKQTTKEDNTTATRGLFFLPFSRTIHLALARTHSASLSLVFSAPFHHRIYTTQVRGDLSDWLWILVEPLAMNMATGLEAAVGK